MWSNRSRTTAAIFKDLNVVHAHFLRSWMNKWSSGPKVKEKKKKKLNETRWRMKNGVWTPFGVTFASSMQTALRQTSNCLFSMRSYRVSLEYDTRTHFILRLCFSLSPSIRSLALARNRLFFLLALAPPCVILSLHWLHIRSLIHELHASIFLSLSDKQASSPFFFFSFGFIIIRWCFVPRHLARRDRLIETTDVDRLSRDFASKRFYRLRGTFLRRFDKQWCNVLMWLFTLIVIVQGVKDDHPFSSSWRDLDMGIDGCLQWGRENRSSVDRSVILERLCVTMEKYIDEKNMANYI